MTSELSGIPVVGFFRILCNFLEPEIGATRIWLSWMASSRVLHHPLLLSIHGRRHRGGDASPQSESGRGTSPQKSRYLQICLKERTKVSRSFKTFKIKWPKFEEKSEFGVGGFDGPESAPPPVKTLWRYHCQYSK